MGLSLSASGRRQQGFEKNRQRGNLTEDVEERRMNFATKWCVLCSLSVKREEALLAQRFDYERARFVVSMMYE